MTRQKLTMRMVVYTLLCTTFALGLPLFHYATALMIAAIVRHWDDSQGLLAPIGRRGSADLMPSMAQD